MLLFGLGENAARAAAVQGVKDLCIPEPPRQNIMPGGNTGQRLTAPRQALPSFRVEMAYAEVFFCYRNSSSETGLHPTRAVSPAASTLRPAVLRIVTVTGASLCGSFTS